MLLSLLIFSPLSSQIGMGLVITAIIHFKFEVAAALLIQGILVPVNLYKVSCDAAQSGKTHSSTEEDAHPHLSL